MSSNNSRIALVTGATGFIGSHLVRRLINEGYKVNIFVRKSSDTWRINDVLSKLKVHLVDLRDPKKVKEALLNIKPEYIFHLAISGVYSGSGIEDRDLFETNLVGTVTLIEAANNINYKALIHTGSTGEYGQKSEIMKETDVCEPANAYGIGKYAATQYASLVAKEKSKPIIILRPFTPFGPRENLGRLINYAITKALKNEELQLSNPGSVRDFIYIEDLINAYLVSISHASQYRGEVFNIGSGQEYTIKYVVEKIKELAGSSSVITWNTQVSRPGESAKWQADISKAKRILGWQPTHNLEEGLIKTIQWFKSQ